MRYSLPDLGARSIAAARAVSLFSTFTTSDATTDLLLARGDLAVLIIVFTIVICIGLKRKDVRA